VLDTPHLMCPCLAETENNTFVKNHLVAAMKSLNWHVEEDTFTDTTPYGVKRFTNVIATKDPAAARRIVLAAHFDSKFFPTSPENEVRLSCHHVIP
jgi:glutaminyl-peptide cyclotransferase